MAPQSARKAKTTDRGLGYRHRQQVDMLKRRHVDGTPCWWCGEPMYLSQSLDGDHSVPRSQGGILADRLLHSLCNSERGDGYHDHLRPALIGKAETTEVPAAVLDTSTLSMPW